MDSRSIVDLLLKSAQDIADKGQTLSEEKLQIPEAGPEREAMLKGLGKGAAVGGVLALLLGTGAGRKVTGSALKLGSLAAIGGLAFQAYQNWQRGQSGSSGAAGLPIDALSGPAAEQRSLTLLRAMIAAANADGHIDDAERGRIEQQMQSMSLDSGTVGVLTEELAKPRAAAEIASAADSPAAAAEIYLTSLAVIDMQDDREKAYLRELALALNLQPELVALLESQAKA
jgi:uncharacterized membrane protein YebE (DUF533 family)